MNRDEVLYLIPYFVSLALAIGVLVYTWSRRSAQGASAFAWYAAGQVLWIAGFILEMISGDMGGKIFWDGFQWFAGLIGVIALPVFVVQYTEHKLKNPRRLFWSSLVIPALFSLCLLTDQYFHWVYADPSLTSDWPFPELAYSFTPVVYVYAVYGYLVALWGLLILTLRISRPHNLYRAQVAIITLGFFLPIFSTVFSLLDIHIAPQRDATPFAVALGNLIITWGLFRFRI